MSGEHRLTIPATLIDIRAVSAWVAEIATDAELPADVVGRIDLALVEICTNIVTHGYGGGSDAPPAPDHGGEIELSAQVRPDSFAVRIVDSARPFNPESIATPDPGEPTVHGYGLMIVRQLTDHLSVDRVDDTNVWTLSFPLLVDGLARS